MKASPLAEALATLGVSDADIAAQGNPVYGPTNEKKLLRYATRQLPMPTRNHRGAQHTHVSPQDGAPQSEDLDVFARAQPASISLDRLLQRSRDRLTPTILIQLGTWNLFAGQFLYIPLPQEARELVVQNNSDLGGAAGHLALTWDGTPANAGDYIVRSGQERSFTIFAEQRNICVWSTVNLTINPGAGATWTGGVWLGYGI